METASRWCRSAATLVAAALALGCGIATQAPVDAPARVSVIAQGSSVEAVAAAVREVGGTVTRELNIIQAVAADVTPEQEHALVRHAAVERVWQDRAVHAQSPGAGR